MTDDLRLVGGRPGEDHGSSFWQAIHRLFGEAFPRLPAAIERAAALGTRWARTTTPFALFAGEEAVAHVGVLAHPMWLDGKLRTFAGIHAVCTRQDRRRQGLARRLLQEALAWADARYDAVKLHTDLPEVYAPHGFRPLPLSRFRSTREPARGIEKRLLAPSTCPADEALLRRLLAQRTPVSLRCSSADDGWLLITDAAILGTLDTQLWYLPQQDAIVGVGEAEDGEPLITEVLAARLPPVEIVLAALPQPGPARFAFAPERFDADAQPVPAPPEAGLLMVRGDWPETLAPLGLSPLWEH
ncbi:MAG: GNAT family N-acetyltransferase [Polyangia bacterium]